MTVYRFTLEADINMQKLDAEDERGHLFINVNPAEWSGADLVEAYQDGFVREFATLGVQEVPS